MFFKFRKHLKWRILCLLDKWGIRHATVFELIEPVWPMKKPKHKIIHLNLVWDKTLMSDDWYGGREFRPKEFIPVPERLVKVHPIASPNDSIVFIKPIFERDVEKELTEICNKAFGKELDSIAINAMKERE